MKITKKTLALLVCIAFSTGVSAQIIDGHTNDITVFHEYKPAIIKLVSGRLNHQKEANVFLKDGSLLYKSGGTVMQANMNQIESVVFGSRCFIKIENRLAEIVDSCGSNLLAVVRIINQAGLENEILNKSTITNIEFSHLLGVTRVEASPDQLIYPVDEEYYFIVGGKTVYAHERNVRRAVGRKRYAAYDTILSSKTFRWNDKESLMEILKLLSE